MVVFSWVMNPKRSQKTVKKNPTPPKKTSLTSHKSGLGMSSSGPSDHAGERLYEKIVHPGRLTWNIIIGVWKIMFLSKSVICRFHVNLPGSRFPVGFLNG